MWGSPLRRVAAKISRHLLDDPPDAGRALDVLRVVSLGEASGLHRASTDDQLLASLARVARTATAQSRVPTSVYAEPRPSRRPAGTRP